MLPKGLLQRHVYLGRHCQFLFLGGTRDAPIASSSSAPLTSPYATLPARRCPAAFTSMSAFLARVARRAPTVEKWPTRSARRASFSLVRHTRSVAPARRATKNAWTSMQSAPLPSTGAFKRHRPRSARCRWHSANAVPAPPRPTMVILMGRPRANSFANGDAAEAGRSSCARRAC